MIERKRDVKRQSKEIERQQTEAKKRARLCLALRMWRAGKTESEIAEAVGYKSAMHILRTSKQYRMKTSKRLARSKHKQAERARNARSKTFATETAFRQYATQEMAKLFPRVRQEVHVGSGVGRRIDMVVESGLFRFGIELKVGNRTARMDQALGQALLKCASLGGLAPVVAVPDDVPLDNLFLSACKRFGVMAGTLTSVMCEMAKSCYGTSRISTPVAGSHP
jgi:hypothetical protein